MMVAKAERVRKLREQLVSDYVTAYEREYWRRYRAQERGMDPQKSWDLFQVRTKYLPEIFEKRCGRIGHRWRELDYLPEFGDKWFCEICDHSKIIEKVRVPDYVVAWKEPEPNVIDEAMPQRARKIRAG